MNGQDLQGIRTALHAREFTLRENDLVTLSDELQVEQLVEYRSQQALAGITRQFE
jgi:hypothetical protein